MSTDSQDAFLPIKDRNGNVTGMMDRTTAEYLASESPNPTQQSLEALLGRVTRVRVVPVSNFRRGQTESVVLLDTSNPDSVASFRRCFGIIEDPETFGHCMCFGDPHFELYIGSTLAATIGYHHGFAIRWDAWKHDARLKEPDRLLDWMSSHGVDGPRREVEDAKRRAEESERQATDWFNAMPTCLHRFWEEMRDFYGPEFIPRVLTELRTGIPDQQGQVLALFGWYGAGAGPWNGIPMYERVPDELLRQFLTPHLIDLLLQSSPTELQWRGAARYFVDDSFRQRRKKDGKLLPDELKQRLLMTARATGIRDNIERAERAFGASGRR